ncbi:MAG TPA: hypothetical protein VFL86_01585 [Burkholderiaceae bacterium]|nr:hypothetical protein [Burkholderiaceae bacterium]
MLADSAKEAEGAHTQMRAQAGMPSTHMAGMRADLVKMNLPALAQQVDEGLLAMGEVGRFIDKVANTKPSLLASQGRMAESLAQLKQVPARQADVSAAVEQRVDSSLTLILRLAIGIWR